MGLGAAIAATAVAGLGGALITGSAAKSAANTQAAAEQQAAQIQEQMYEQTAARLQPFTNAGVAATGEISNMSPFAFNPTMTQLENSPGYQFNLYQGEKAVQNSAAARGLGVSGAEQKGAAAYASGLAGNQYQNLFNNALSTYNTNLSRLQGQASLGENAGAMTGNYGTQTAQAIGQTAVGAANAEAAGTIGAANAAAGGLGSLSNAFLTSQLFGGGNMFGTGGTTLSASQLPSNYTTDLGNYTLPTPNYIAAPPE